MEEIGPYFIYDFHKSVKTYSNERGCKKIP